MKILITGITGFVGSHLAESYLADGHSVCGTYIFHHLDDEFDRIAHIKDRLKLYECDLRDRNSVWRVINKVRPDIIHHLAAQSFVKISWENPEFTIFNNIQSQLNIFEVCRQLNHNPIIHIAGSSEEYGLVGENELPIKEENPLRPMSPYAVSKIGQDMLAQQYFHSYGLSVIITRAFNHEGPRRGRQFVTSNFACQAIEIIRGKRKNFKVGNLDIIRDYTDISDMIRAYRLAVEKCDFGEPYNICSGIGRKISEIFDYYADKIGERTEVNYKIIEDPERMRPSDLPILIGDNTRFREKTGWKPEISFKEMLDKIFNYWEKKL